MKPDNQLKALVEEARNTKLYRALYSKLELDFQFDEIPFLEAGHLRDIRPDYFADFNEALCVYFTGGTTAEPKAFYRSLGDLEYAKEYIRWIQGIEGIAGGEKIAIFMEQSFWGVGYLTLIGSIKAGNAVIPIDDDLPREVVANLIRLSQPTVLSGLSSTLLEYMDVLKCSSLKIVETTGEPLTANIRNTLETTFNAEVYDSYGLTEGIVGVECSEHDGYHFRPDLVFLEIIDPELQKVLNEEEWGEMILTVRNKFSVNPIIRYRTGDICKISYQPCTCGNATPKIWVKGRKEQTVFVYDGCYIPKKTFEKIIQEAYGKPIRYVLKVIREPGSALLEIAIEDLSKNDFIISKIKNLNYETIYLTKRNKLHVLVRKL